MLYVPILYAGKVHGVISLQSFEKEHAFDAATVQLVESVAGSLGGALENARLFDETTRLLQETQQRNAELAVINTVQSGLASKLEYDAVIDLVGEQIGDIFKSDTTFVALYDPDSEIISYDYYVEKGQRRKVETRPLDDPEGLGPWVVRTRQSTVVNGWDDMPEGTAIGPVPSPGSEEDLNLSAANAPILHGDKILGVLSVQNHILNAYDEIDLRLLETLAASLAVALENARLFDETARLLQETQQHNAELAVINSVQSGMASQMEMQGIYELVGETIHNIFEGHTVIIATYDEAQRVATYNYLLEEGQRHHGLQVPFKRFHDLMIETGETLTINENLKKRVAPLGFEDSITGDLPQSTINVPLISGGKVFGHVSLENMEREHAYNDSDVRLLETLTSAMSVALESARRFEQIQQRNAELAVINTVQEGLVARQDYQGIIDLVGDKLREVFGTGNIGIRTLDKKSGLIHFRFEYEHGERLAFGPQPFGGLNKHIITSRETVLANENVAETIMALGGTIIPDTDTPVAFLGVPILAGDEAIGVVTLEGFEKNTFSKSDVRLLETLSASHGCRAGKCPLVRRNSAAQC